MSQAIHTNHKKSLYLLASIPILSNLFFTISTYATSTTKNFTFAIEVTDTPTLTMVLSESKLTLGLTPGMASNTFSSGDLNVTVGTSNNAGYTLTMTADSSSLSTTSGNTIPSLVPKTGGYTENEFTTNSWGIKRHNGIYADTNYRDIPGTDELPVNSYNYAIDPTSNPNDTNYSNSTATVTFAAKVDKTQAAGEYKADLTFKATANVVASNCSSKTICYNDNGASSTTTMANQTTADDNTTIESGDQVTLWASNYQRANYGFLGWMTTPSPEADTKYYGPNETITADATLEGSGITLYANWLAKSNRYTMQTFTSAVCKNELTPASYNSTTGAMTVSPNSFMALEDIRDGNTYAVARLNDGNCWMIENLRLADTHKDAQGNTVTTELTPHNTNNPSLPLTNIHNADPALATTSNHLSATSGTWCTQSTVACNDQSFLNASNTASTVSNMTGPTNSNIYSYGNYYNWYSATAGNGKHDTVNGEILSQNMSTMGDICPTNWELPKGGAFPNTDMHDANGIQGTEATDNRVNSDFYKLFYGMLGQAPNVVNDSLPSYTLYGDVAVANSYQSASNLGTISNRLARMYPNNFINAGYWSTSQAFTRGTGGSYWSSTATNSNQAYRLLVSYAPGIYPGTSSINKFYGSSVRCLAGN